LPGGRLAWHDRPIAGEKMDDLILETLEALRGAGWTVEPALSPRPLPPHIVARYPHLAPLAVDFFAGVESCTRGDEACWFLTAADYARQPGPNGESWDEFERIVARPDDEAGRAFWDSHLIVFQFVGGDYEFMAIGTDPESTDFGAIVHGDLIDFDSAIPLARSFADLLTQLRDVARGAPTRSNVYENYLALFVHAHIIEDGSRPPWEKGIGATLRRWPRRR
jgi:hypothetical protein